jgi:hypothetical protein
MHGRLAFVWLRWESEEFYLILNFGLKHSYKKLNINKRLHSIKRTPLIARSSMALAAYVPTRINA